MSVLNEYSHCAVHTHAHTRTHDYNGRAHTRASSMERFLKCIHGVVLLTCTYGDNGGGSVSSAARARTHRGLPLWRRISGRKKNEIQVGRLVVIEETQSAHYYYDIPVQRSAAVHDERPRYYCYYGRSKTIF